MRPLREATASICGFATCGCSSARFHLIRDVRYLTTLPGLDDVIYGTRLLMALEKLFGVIHLRETLSAEEFEKQLQGARDQVLAVGVQETGTPNSQRMAKRMRKYGREYFTFVTTPGVEGVRPR